MSTIYIVSSTGRQILPGKFTYSIFILLNEKSVPDSLSGDKGSMMLFFSPAVNILLSVKRVQKLSKLDTGEKQKCAKMVTATSEKKANKQLRNPD